MSLTFANKLTLGRILAVPFFVGTVLYYTPERDYLRFVTLGVFLVAVITDVVDGYVARTFRQKTRAGAILDPLADKFLLMNAYLWLNHIGSFEGLQFPIWLIVAVISRDAILILGAMIIQLVNGEVNVRPNVWGKLTAFLQVMCVLGLLLQWKASSILWPITVAGTIISGFEYIRSGIKVLNSAEKVKV